jgi:hypothetical protein
MRHWRRRRLFITDPQATCCHIASAGRRRGSIREGLGRELSTAHCHGAEGQEPSVGADACARALREVAGWLWHATVLAFPASSRTTGRRVAQAQCHAVSSRCGGQVGNCSATAAVIRLLVLCDPASTSSSEVCLVPVLRACACGHRPSGFRPKATGPGFENCDSKLVPCTRVGASHGYLCLLFSCFLSGGDGFGAQIVKVDFHCSLRPIQSVIF